MSYDTSLSGALRFRGQGQPPVVEIPTGEGTRTYVVPEPNYYRPAVICMLLAGLLLLGAILGLLIALMHSFHEFNESWDSELTTINNINQTLETCQNCTENVVELNAMFQCQNCTARWFEAYSTFNYSLICDMMEDTLSSVLYVDAGYPFLDTYIGCSGIQDFFDTLALYTRNWTTISFSDPGSFYGDWDGDRCASTFSSSGTITRCNYTVCDAPGYGDFNCTSCHPEADGCSPKSFNIPVFYNLFDFTPALCTGMQNCTFDWARLTFNSSALCFFNDTIFCF